MENKILVLNLKAATETGVFEGRLSTYGGPPDRVGDVVQPGAFSKTLQESGGIVPLLLGHDSNKQVGILRLRDSASALVANGEFNMDSPLAREAHSQLRFNAKNGLRHGLSIGYRVIKSFAKNGVRYLTEVELFEGSLTPIPANVYATVEAVKRQGTSELDEMRADFQAKLDRVMGRRPATLEDSLQDFARRAREILR